MITFPQPFAAIAREQNVTIGNRKDWIAEVAVLAADAIEIVAEMTVLGEPLRVVGKRAVLVSEWKIKSRRGGERSEFQWRRQIEGRIEFWRRRQFWPKSNDECDQQRDEKCENAKEHSR